MSIAWGASANAASVFGVSNESDALLLLGASAVGSTEGSIGGPSGVATFEGE